MLSKMVFLAGEPNFPAPPVHAARADVRDHVESQEGDHSASYAYDRGLQKRRQANIVFREIWGAAQFSTFSTASANLRQNRTLIVAHLLVSSSYMSWRSVPCVWQLRPTRSSFWRSVGVRRIVSAEFPRNQC